MLMTEDDKLALRAIGVAAIFLVGGFLLALVSNYSDVSETPTPPPVVEAPPIPLPPPPSVRPKVDRFPVVIERVLVHEGGATYTNHPADPGGPTKWGITIWDVRKHLNPNATASDVKRLTKEQALEIYRKAYWNALAAGELPVGVDYVVTDYGINAGIARAGKALRRAVGFGDDLGKVTYEVLLAVSKTDPKMLIAMISQARMQFQMGLPAKYDVFKRGWKRRIQETEKQAYLDQEGRVAKGIFSDHITGRAAPGKAPSFLED